MSSYIDPVHPDAHAPYTDLPQDALDYLHYMQIVTARSPRTVNAYYLDLRTFFRFMVVRRRALPQSSVKDLQELKVNTSALDHDFVISVTKEDIYEYLAFLQNEAQNTPTTRARKLSALKGFYHYLKTNGKLPGDDPTRDIARPNTKKRLPKYLSLEECLELLHSVNSDFYERDFCILTLFLNCGMRLTELVTMDLADFQTDTVRIIGKGNKERLVYLNTSCQDAMTHYLAERAALPNLKDKKALFVSRRTGKRLSPRRVEQIVDSCLRAAGLGDRGYSPHKLRHTAATLMYRGGADMLSLKEILGHENVSTTQIYTHIDTEQLRKTVRSSPLSTVPYQPPRPAEQEEPESEQDDEEQTDQ